MKTKLFPLLICALLWACSNGLGDGILTQADKEYSQGNYLKAETLYEQYLQANPQGSKRWDAWQRLVKISTTVTRNHRKAAQLLEAMQLEYTDNPEKDAALDWKLAEVYTTLHDWDKAAETWQALLEQPTLTDEQFSDIHWNLGKIYQYQGRYGMAKDAMLSCMERTTENNPHVLCMYELAQAYSLLKNRDQSKAWLDKILLLENTDEELHALASYLLAEIMESEGNYDRARELLTAIRKTHPNPLVVETRLKQLAKH